MTATDFLLELSTYSALPAVILGLLFRISKFKEYKYAFYYAFGSLVSDVSYSLLWDVTPYAQYIGSIWQIVHLITAGMFFIVLSQKKTEKTWFWALLTIGCVLSFLDLSVISVAIALPSISLIISMLAICYFYALYKKESNIHLKDNFPLWIALVFFFSHSGQFFSTLLSNQIANTFDTYNLWSIVLVLNIMTNFAIGYAFFKYGRRVRT